MESKGKGGKGEEGVEYRKRIEEEGEGIEEEGEGREKEGEGIEKEGEGIEKEGEGIEKEGEGIEKERIKNYSQVSYSWFFTYVYWSVGFCYRNCWSYLYYIWTNKSLNLSNI